MLIIPLAGLLGGICVTAGMPLFTYVNIASILVALGIDLHKTDFKCRASCGKFFNRYQFYYMALTGTFLMGTFGIDQERKKQQPEV